jgi:hypothetical protein
MEHFKKHMLLGEVLYLVLMDAHFQMSYVELVQKHKLIIFRIKYITEI